MPKSDSPDFFDEPREQSLVKSDIVVSYFAAWSAILIRRAPRIGYLDLYAGPGRYGEDGRASTPLLILEHAIDNEALRRGLVTVFNDANPGFVESLRQEINDLPGVNLLSHRPTVVNEPVDDTIVSKIGDVGGIPCLSFIDPWGYKGLSLDLIRALVKDWGSEAIFSSTTTVSTWASPTTLSNRTWRRF